MRGFRVATHKSLKNRVEFNQSDDDFKIPEVFLILPTVRGDDVWGWDCTHWDLPLLTSGQRNQYSNHLHLNTQTVESKP